MNIFYLDENPQLAAEYHCDKHVVKMCIEYVQLLSTFMHYFNPEYAKTINIYKSTHYNHPCNKWLRESIANYNWLHTLATYLGKEYTLRYKKTHKSIREHLSQMQLIEDNRSHMTPIPLCMPDEYKNTHNSVLAYRNYYMGEKAYFAKWGYSKIPYWWNV